MTEQERQAWNDCLAKGDVEEIEAKKDELLVDIHTRIMNDDPCYSVAGWRPTR